MPQLRELMLGQRLRAYLWTLLGPARALPRRRAGSTSACRGCRTSTTSSASCGRRQAGRAAGQAAALPLPQVRPRPGRRRDPPLQPADLREVPPRLQVYGPAFLKTIHYNAHRLSARYAENNGARLAARLLSRARLRSPIPSGRSAPCATTWLPGRGLAPMRLHVLPAAATCCARSRCRSEVLAALIGPRLRPATAFWLAPHCGSSYHDFLLEPAGGSAGRGLRRRRCATISAAASSR